MLFQSIVEPEQVECHPRRRLVLVVVHPVNKVKVIRTRCIYFNKLSGCHDKHRERPDEVNASGASDLQF